MTTLQDDPRTYTNTTGMLKIPARTDLDFTTAQPLAEDPALVGALWPQRKKGAGAGDFVLMDALEPSRRYQLSSANAPKLDPAGINGTSCLLFGDGTPELPATAEGNGSLRFDDVPLIGVEGTVSWVQRVGTAGKGAVWATIPIVTGLLSVTINNSGFVEFTLGGPGRIYRRDVDIRGQAAEMWTLCWRPDGATDTLFNVFRNKALVSAPNGRLAGRVVPGRPMFGAHGNVGATPGAPAANLYLGEWYPCAEDLSVPSKAARLALVHARLNWRHSMGLA